MIELLGKEMYEKERQVHLQDRSVASPEQATGEIGCVLSHLLAVRQAYLAGDQVALILEDDVGPFLLPFWTRGIGDVIDDLNRHAEGWETAQLGWWIPEGPDSVPQENVVAGYLARRQFTYLTSAYLISRPAMEKVMDKHFADKTATGKVIPALEGMLQIDASGYYGSLMAANYIVMPAMFITHARGSSIGKSDRDEQHAKLNMEMMQYAFQKLQASEFYSRSAAPSDAATS